MKRIFLFAAVALLVGSCGPTYKCYPSKGSRDWSFVKKVKEGYLVTTRKLDRVSHQLYECNPCEVEPKPR